MKSTNVRMLFALGAVLMMWFGMVATPIQAAPGHAKANGKVTLNTDNISVEINGNGNVPQFTYWANGDSSNTSYQVKLNSLFEATDMNGDGMFHNGNDTRVPGGGVALASASWNFSDFSTAQNGDVNFNLTSTNLSFEIQFRFHLSANEQNSLKFDVVINGYSFKNSNAMLVLSFTLLVKDKSNQNGNDNPDTQDSRNQTRSEVKYGNGYFQSQDTAHDNNGTVGVGLASGNNGGKRIYIAYQHFNGDLVHDPTLGVRASSLESASSTSDQRSTTSVITKNIFEDLSIGKTVGMTAFLTFAFLTGIMVISRKKRN